MRKMRSLNRSSAAKKRIYNRTYGRKTDCYTYVNYTNKDVNIKTDFEHDTKMLFYFFSVLAGPYMLVASIFMLMYYSNKPNTKFNATIVKCLAISSMSSLFIICMYFGK